MDASAVFSMQLMLSKFEYDDKLNPSFRTGAFELPVGAMCPPSVYDQPITTFPSDGLVHYDAEFEATEKNWGVLDCIGLI
jgi:hypothetical protein